MQSVQLDDVTLEYDEVGSGDPLLLIHGGLIDTFFPDPAGLSIANSHRVISYWSSTCSQSRRFVPRP